MPRPSVIKMFRVIEATITNHRLDRRWHSVCKLCDKLAIDGHDDVVAVIYEILSRSSDWTSSVFIEPALQYVREELNGD